MFSKKAEQAAGRAPRLDPGLSEWPGSGTIVMAFSGGPDSACLLHLLVQNHADRPLRAVHVDHGLDRGSARRAEQAWAMGQRLGVDCHVERVQVRRSGSIEANARRARYKALSHHIGVGDVLVTAHHADDVAETLLLRMLRGSGPGGLGGIPAQRNFGRGHLIRPLLGWRREEIQAYLEQRQLTGIHDPANDLVSLDRNFLRHEILPLLREHFPGCIQAFSRSASLNRAAAKVLAQLADTDLEQARHPGPCLQLKALHGLDPFRQAEAVRRWCIQNDCSPPPGQRLDEFMRQLEQAADDRQPALDWEEGRLQRHGGGLWLRPPSAPQIAWCVDWDGNDSLQLPGASGSLRMSGQPIGLVLTVRSGQPGERLCLRPGAGRRPVKKLLAESGVPPWERPEWPRIWRGDQLVAVGDRWLDADFDQHLKHVGARLIWQSSLRRSAGETITSRIQ